MKITFKEILPLIYYYQNIYIEDTQGRGLYYGSIAEKENQIGDDVIADLIIDIYSKELSSREVFNVSAVERDIHIIVSKSEEEK